MAAVCYGVAGWYQGLNRQQQTTQVHLEMTRGTAHSLNKYTDYSRYNHNKQTKNPAKLFMGNTPFIFRLPMSL